jgi:hypothetical protein
MALIAWMLVFVAAWAQAPAPAAAPAEVASAAEEVPAEAPVEAAGAVPAEVPAEAPVEGEEIVEPEVPSPWSAGLVTSFIALGIGGLSAVLGIWVDRDKSRPTIFAATMSVLITAAVTVSLTQGYLDAVSAIQQKADLQRMLDMVDEIAESSGDPALADLVASEAPAGRKGRKNRGAKASQPAPGAPAAPTQTPAPAPAP